MNISFKKFERIHFFYQLLISNLSMQFLKIKSEKSSQLFNPKFLTSQNI